MGSSLDEMYRDPRYSVGEAGLVRYGVLLPSDEYLRLMGEALFLYGAFLDRVISGAAYLYRNVSTGAVNGHLYEEYVRLNETFAHTRKHLFAKASSGMELKKALDKIVELCAAFSGKSEMLRYAEGANAALGLDLFADESLTYRRNLISHASPIISPFDGVILKRLYLAGPEDSDAFSRILDVAWMQDYLRDLNVGLEEFYSFEKSFSITQRWDFGDSQVDREIDLYQIVTHDRFSIDEERTAYEALPPLDEAFSDEDV